MEQPFFSVVVPTYNRVDQLSTCLDSLAAQSFPSRLFEVIVVDDGSTDGTADVVRGRRFPYSCSVFSIPNGGASVARNRGIAEAQGGCIALTEDDVVPDKEWLFRAHEYLNGGRIDVLEGRTTYLGTGKDVRKFESQTIPSFIPCNLFILKSVFDHIGGYDPDFYDGRHHLYFREDADLGFRIMDAGYRLALAPDVCVAHPPQFGELAECLRHSRRYVFDPLLYRKHARRFRAMIEVKTFAGVTIHRPQHYVALIYLSCLVAAATGGAMGMTGWFPAFALIAFACSCLFRFKYQGNRALRLYRVEDTIGFLAVPLVYLWAVCRGCVRYKTAGPLL